MNGATPERFIERIKQVPEQAREILGSHALQLRPRRILSIAAVLGLASIAMVTAACNPAQAQVAAEARQEVLQAEQTKLALPNVATIPAVNKDVSHVPQASPTVAETPTSEPSPTIIPTIAKPKDTATAISTATAPATATATASPTHKANLIPDGPSFGGFDVFSIILDNGERGMIVTLPDGKVVAASTAQKPGCGPSTLLLNGYWVGSYEKGKASLNFRGTTDQVTVISKFTGEGQIEGSLSRLHYTLHDGPTGQTFLCPDVTENYKGKYEGAGMEPLLDTFRQMLKSLSSNADLGSVFERKTKLKLSDYANFTPGK